MSVRVLFATAIARADFIAAWRKRTARTFEAAIVSGGRSPRFARDDAARVQSGITLVRDDAERAADLANEIPGVTCEEIPGDVECIHCGLRHFSFGLLPLCETCTRAHYRAMVRP